MRKIPEERKYVELDDKLSQKKKKRLHDKSAD